MASLFTGYLGVLDGLPRTIMLFAGMVLANGVLLLVFALVLYAFFTATVNRKVKRLHQAEEREREAAIRQQREGLQNLLQFVTTFALSMQNASGCVQEGAELARRQQCEKKGAYVSPMSPGARRAFLIEALALEKALKHLDRMLQEGIVLGQLDVYLAWYNDLSSRFEEAWYQEAQQPLPLVPSVVEALLADAKQVWRDTIAFTPDTAKDFLLESLQCSLVQGQIAFAEAARTLERKGSDAQWQAAGQYRKALIHWSSQDAIRLVLRARQDGGIDLADVQVVEQYFEAYVQALTQKCADDQATLSWVLCTIERAESRVVLPA